MSHTPQVFSTGIRDSVFGTNCTVADCVNIYKARLGDNCFVGPWVEIQNDVVIGNNTRIQSHTLICERMTIGDNCFIGHGVMTANCSHPRSGDKSWKCNPPQIGNNVMIGSHAVILPGVKIGDYAQIGAGAVVTKDIPPNTVVIGNPARPV
jgi:acetyltransferase-like isoleucine patch superfamily enzyme